MNINIFLIALFTMSVLDSCNYPDSRQVSQKEPGLQEKAIVLNQKESDPIHDEGASVVNQQSGTNYKKIQICAINLELPTSFTLISDNSEESLDYCDYTIKTKDGKIFGQLHTLNNGRFVSSNINDLYQSAQNTSDLTISYKSQKANWFVISGIDKATKNIVYWKRVSGDLYVSDLRIEYPPEQKSNFEPYISRIASSFTSQ